MCACMRARVHAHTFVSAHSHVWVYASINVCVYAGVLMDAHVCMFVYAHTLVLTTSLLFYFLRPYNDFVCILTTLMFSSAFSGWMPCYCKHSLCIFHTRLTSIVVLSGLSSHWSRTSKTSQKSVCCCCIWKSEFTVSIIYFQWLNR